MALHGYACRYSQVFRRRAEHVSVLMPGCFNSFLRSGEAVSFLLEHKPSQLIGSTKAELELYEHPDAGIAFRLHSPPSAVLNVVKSGARRSMSIGLNIVQARMEKIAGWDVELIDEAEFPEISMVRRGAINNTCISIVDTRNSCSLREAAVRGDLANDGAYARLMNAVEDFRNEISAYLPASIDARPKSARRRPPLIDTTRAKSAWLNLPGNREKMKQLQPEIMAYAGKWHSGEVRSGRLEGGAGGQTRRHGRSHGTVRASA